MNPVAPVLMLFSVLFPTKLWFAPNQPFTIEVRAQAEMTLVLTDFVGKAMDPRSPADVHAERVVDLKEFWPQISSPGTYLLYAVPKGKGIDEFAGTPLMISVQADHRRDAPPGPMVIHIEPLSYAMVRTEKGDMTIAFYYDVAPHTVDNFLELARGGYFDGLTFHRIVPEFVIQGGDPRGDGTGGPGYQINEEFNDREHREGVVSMAREGDPLEQSGAMPRCEAANSAGSQFFICLNYQRTKQLDRRYTAFGKVVEGMDVVNALAKVEIDPATDRPKTPPIITSITVMPVQAGKNPYPTLLSVTAESPDSR